MHLSEETAIGDPSVTRPGRPTLYLTRRIPEPGASLLQEVFTVVGSLEDRPASPAEMIEHARGVEAILCLLSDRIDARIMDAAGPTLRVISNFAVGYDNVDVAAATARRVLVTYTPGVLTEATADLTWSLILSSARHVIAGDALVRRGDFHGWSPFLLLGVDVFGKTLGLIGMGRIGRAVARRAAGFGMRVIYTDRSGPVPREETPAGAEWVYHSTLDSVLSTADIVSVHVPLTEGTRHLIGSRELALMRKSSILINTARGPVVDEGALVEALRSGPLGAAGLDVYEDEPSLAEGLAELENAVLLPHLGSATVETRSRMAELAARNAIAAVKGEPVPYPVNPEVLS